MSRVTKTARIAKVEEWTPKNAGEYCGCCGFIHIGPTAMWCAECSKHVLKEGVIWDRTYWAVTGKDCPVAVRERCRS